MLTPTHAIQALRYLSSSIQQKIRGPKRYPGNAEKICKQIIEDCWNGRYYETSTHHYREFWARDFGYCAEHLVTLGHKNRALATLDYALSHYAKTGIKTTISRNGKPFSFPNVYSPDSVALLFHALRVAHATKLAQEYRDFLQHELTTYANTVLENGRVKRHTHFSGMRDHARHDSSCYNHCMSILLAREARQLGFDFPYNEHELTKNLEEYWTGTHYKDDRANKEASGDANALPSWMGIKKHFNKSLKTIQEHQLDTPVPLAYSSHQRTHMLGTEWLVPGWQHHTLWPFLGLLWSHAAKKNNPALAQRYKKQYAELIERDGTLYEVYKPDGNPYQSLFYHADEGMLWASMWLTL